MEYTVQKLAKTAGVSGRTLRYYDEIGLLKPARINSSGYRIYGKAEVDRLQQIMFYRVLGVGLTEILKIMNDPDYDRLSALKSHLEELETRKVQIDLLIQNVTKTVEQEEGKRVMSDHEKFEGMKAEALQENETLHGEEIRRKYGNETVKQSNRKFSGLSEDEYQRMQEMAEEIINRLEAAVEKGEEPVNECGKRLTALHKEWLSFTWPVYSMEAHKGLAQMYVEDERFRKYYDVHREGCAAFLRDSISYWAELLD